MDKPLPELPQSKPHRGLKHIQATSKWATLTTEAQAHLRTGKLKEAGWRWATETTQRGQREAGGPPARVLTSDRSIGNQQETPGPRARRMDPF